MTFCSEVEKEISEENGKEENFPVEISKILAALEAIPLHLIGGKSLVYQQNASAYGHSLETPRTLC